MWKVDENELQLGKSFKIKLFVVFHVYCLGSYLKVEFSKMGLSNEV